MNIKMNAFEFAAELDKQFGNPLGPKRYAIVKDAVDVIRFQAQEITSLQSQISELMAKLEQ